MSCSWTSTAQKISKSKGNGLSVDDWLRYAPAESLAQFMYNQPQRAKRLYFDVIPRAVDEYIANAGKALTQQRRRTADQPGLAHPCRADAELGGQPDLFRHAAQPRQRGERGQRRTCSGASSAATSRTRTPRPSRCWPGWSITRSPTTRISSARRSSYRQPDANERAALTDLAETLAALPADADAEAIQNAVFEVGKRHDFPELRDWFGCLYQVLLGQQEGPRFGGFVALYGLPETIALIESALSRPPRRPEAAAAQCQPSRAGRAEAGAAPPAGAARAWCCCSAPIYVVQREFRNLKLADIEEALAAIPHRALAISFLWTILSYGILTFYDRLGTIYAGHKVSYGRVAFASFCAYALSHNLGFAAVSGAAVRYRLYAHWGLTPLQIAKTVAFCRLTFGLGGMVLGGFDPVHRADHDPVLRRARCRAGDVCHRRRAVGDRRRLRDPVAGGRQHHACSATRSSCRAGGWRSCRCCWRPWTWR